MPAGLEQYYSQQLDWEACSRTRSTADQKELYSSEDLECARLKVPLAYPEPGTVVADGASVQIGVLRKVATDEADRIGSVVFNPGGPGGSGMDFVASLVSPPEDPSGAEPDPTAVATAKSIATLNESFDLVGFDPRGVGASLPTVQCQTDAERDASRAQVPRSRNQADVDAANAAQQKIAELCVQRTGVDEGIDGKEFLANIGTRDVARDLDVLRAVLGDEKLTYVGFSYGTSIGTVYAEQFPENVRALILDGAVDPTEDPATSAINQAAGVPGRLRGLRSLVRQTDECACSATTRARRQRSTSRWCVRCWTNHCRWRTAGCSPSMTRTPRPPRRCTSTPTGRRCPPGCSTSARATARS